MSNAQALRTLAEMAKQSNPSDARTVDELEAYFRGLQSASPFALAVQAECAALDQEVIDAEDRAEMIQYAAMLRDQPEWERLSRADLREQLDIHLESNFPEARDEIREEVVRLVTRKAA